MIYFYIYLSISLAAASVCMLIFIHLYYNGSDLFSDSQFNKLHESMSCQPILTFIQLFLYAYATWPILICLIFVSFLMGLIKGIFKTKKG